MTRDDSEWTSEGIDFTIARGVSSTAVIESVWSLVAERVPEQIKVDRHDLNDRLGDSRLSKSDAQCLFTGLTINGAASQAASAQSFADYTFTVDTERAASVLEEQRIARLALEEAGALGRNDSSVQLTGTFPPAMDVAHLDSVRPLSDDLRRIFFGADSVVRIANPYFDPSPSVVGDIASLADRGVRTKILTRETASADDNLRSALNAVFEEIDPSNRESLQVRDLYKEVQGTDRQAYATHAKIAIADREICYVGSANLTDTSLSSNFELGVLVRGSTVDDAVEVFDTVFDFSRPVHLPL